MKEPHPNSPNGIASRNGYALVRPKHQPKSSRRDIIDPSGKVVRRSATHEEVLEFFHYRGLGPS